MTKQEVYQRGIQAGYEAAIYTEVSEDDQQACCACEDSEECADCLGQAAYESEKNARQYSPFEFLAHAIKSRDPLAQWEAYDKGVSAGIKRGIKQRLGR